MVVYEVFLSLHLDNICVIEDRCGVMAREFCFVVIYELTNQLSVSALKRPLLVRTKLP